MRMIARLRERHCVMMACGSAYFAALIASSRYEAT